MGAFAAEIESTGDDGQHSRGMYGIGGKIGNVRSQNTERDLDGSVVNAVFDKVNDFSDHQTYRNASRRQIQEAQKAGADGRCMTSNKQRDPEFKREQGAGIIP